MMNQCNQCSQPKRKQLHREPKRASDFSCCKYNANGTLTCGTSCNPKEVVKPSWWGAEQSGDKDEQYAFDPEEPSPAAARERKS